MQSTDVLEHLDINGSTIGVNSQYEFSYNVLTTDKIFSVENNTILNVCKNKKLLIVISETVERLYSQQIYAYFEAHFSPDRVRIMTVKTTEANKNMDNVLSICKAGKQFGLDRTSLMVAIGGGILMDMVGFAASMYKRKLDYVRIPTTLVGQIDAGIGIKTAVNFNGSKNFIGAFHPPIAALNDRELLMTLPEKEIICGLAEIIKMGIIVDSHLFEIVESKYLSLIKYRYQEEERVSNNVNQMAIQRMLEQLIVNFYERDLERFVDFGHTFSPFIEEFSSYKVKHGIAVGIDMAISTEISYLKGKISERARNRIQNLILNIGINTSEVLIYNTELMHESLSKIVLHRGGNLNLVIPTDVGKAVFIKDLADIPLSLLKQACNNLKKYRNKV